MMCGSDFKTTTALVDDESGKTWLEVQGATGESFCHCALEKKKKQTCHVTSSM